MTETSPQYSRSRRATLTGASSLLNYGGTLLIGLIITPIIVGFLGMEMYGVWIMLGQLFGYISIVDLCPTRVLKLTLATEQHSADDGLKRRQVGAAVLLATMVLPLFLLTGATVIWLFPQLVKLDPELQSAVRWALAIMVLDAATRNFTSIPGSVLRAMNLDYLAMGVSTAVSILTAVMNVVVLMAGLGLVGMAAVTFAGVLVSSWIRFRIVRRRVAWFGISRPGRGELRSLSQKSLWFMSDSITTTLGQHSESLLIGVFLGPAVVSAFALTKSLGRMVFEVLGQLFSSVNPGLADLAGRGETEKLRELRGRLLRAAVFVSLGAGTVVYLWNGPFVGLWVGTDKFAGNGVTALLLIFLALKLLVGINRGFMGALLLIKQENLSASIRNVLTFLGLLVAVYYYGLWGALAVMIAGESGLLGYLSQLLHEKLPCRHLGTVRLLTAVIALSFAAAILKDFVTAQSWSTLGALVFASALLLFPAAALLTMNSGDWRFWSARLGRPRAAIRDS